MKAKMISILDEAFRAVSDIPVTGQNADRVCLVRSNMRRLFDMINSLPDDQEAEQDG